MQIAAWLDNLPLPAWFFLTVAFVFFAISAGIGVNRLMRARDSDSDVRSVVGAILSLLAFLLAFTFNMSANRYEARKQFFLDEVNAIGTTYLRAGLLVKPYSTQMRELLRDYINVRACLFREKITVAQAITRSESIQDTLWSDTEGMVAHHEASRTDSLYIQSLNQMIDMEGKRVAVGLYFRIPRTIWAGLYAISALSMVAVGYQFGRSGRRSWLIYLVLALAFSSVIVLIADLDRAAEGTVLVNQEPILNLQRKVDASRSAKPLCGPGPAASTKQSIKAPH